MIPTEDGYYWCVDGEGERIVYVDVKEDRVYITGHDLWYSIAEFTDWQGPLKSPYWQHTPRGHCLVPGDSGKIPENVVVVSQWTKPAD